MICKDTRPCCFRGRSTIGDPNECSALASKAAPYPDGKCPFCKENIFDNNAKEDVMTAMHGKKTRRHKVKPIAVQNPESDFFAELEERIKLCANIYGADYKKHLRLFRGLKNLILMLQAKIAEYEEMDRWRTLPKELPDEDDLCLVTVFDGQHGKDEDYGREVRAAVYNGRDFEVDGDPDNELVVMAWKPLDEAWRISDDAEGDTEQDAAE